MFISSPVYINLSKFPFACSNNSASYSNAIISSISFSFSRYPAFVVSILIKNKQILKYFINIYFLIDMYIFLYLSEISFPCRVVSYYNRL